MHYDPPSAQNLRTLRDQRSFTNSQLAEIFRVSSSGQFHKYLSEKDKRQMGYHVLMVGMLNLALMEGPVTDIEQLHDRARELGAVIDLDGDPE
jgi:hypothetical protein